MALLHQNQPRSLGASLAKLTGLADTGLVLALRERTRELPPTWKDTLAKRAAFVAKSHARWVSFEREDAARLLALASLLAAARSGDVTDLSGRKIALETVRKWVAEALGVPRWPVLTTITAPDEQGDDDRMEPAGPPMAARSGTAMAVLLRLRVASLDRLVREAARIDKTATRSSVMLELERGRERIAWVGTALVCIRGES